MENQEKHPGLHGVMVAHVQQWIVNYMAQYHPKCHNLDFIREFFDEGEELELSHPRLLYAYVISCAEYHLWYQGLSPDVRDLYERHFPQIKIDERQRAWRRAIRRTLRSFEGSLFTRLKNHLFFSLGFRKDRPQTARWYHDQLKRL